MTFGRRKKGGNTLWTQVSQYRYVRVRTYRYVLVQGFVSGPYAFFVFPRDERGTRGRESVEKVKDKVELFFTGTDGSNR